MCDLSPPATSNGPITWHKWPEDSARHDDVIGWKHFPRYWPFVRGIHRSPVNSPQKISDAELWCFLWSVKNGWINNREADDLRRHRAHYDVIVMIASLANNSWNRKDISFCIMISSVFAISTTVILFSSSEKAIISHYLIQCWPSWLTHICGTRGRWELNMSIACFNLIRCGLWKNRRTSISRFLFIFRMSYPGLDRLIQRF